MSEYVKQYGIKHTPVTPEDPQCNGFAENFVKLLCKFIHTTIVEGNDPKKELQKYLLNTPHQYREITSEASQWPQNENQIATTLPT